MEYSEQDIEYNKQCKEILDEYKGKIIKCNEYGTYRCLISIEGEFIRYMTPTTNGDWITRYKLYTTKLKEAFTNGEIVGSINIDETYRYANKLYNT